MIVIGVSCMLYFCAVLWCPPCHAIMREIPPVGCCNRFMILLRWVAWVTEYTDPSNWVVAYGSKEDLILNAMVGLYLNDISAYDPSSESMLVHVSPSYKIAIMITGLVIDCLGTNNYLVTKSSLLKLT